MVVIQTLRRAYPVFENLLCGKFNMQQVYVFPGQGSQFKGMGADLFPKYPEYVKQADELLGYSIVDLCLNDPEELLNLTQYTQPALYVVNALSLLEQLKNGVVPDVYAGHSLGEFNALLAAGAYDFATGLKIVIERGRIMSRATGGSMAAVIGLNYEKVEQIILDNDLSEIDIANINSSEQIIISGAIDQIDHAADTFSSEGARFIKLKVSAAFHSRFMKDSQAEFRKYLDGCDFLPLTAKVISNWSADFYPNEHYLDLMENQLSNPVKWYLSISKLIACDDVEFTEIGPSMVLTRLCQGIQKNPAEIDISSLSDTWRSIGKEQSSYKNIFMFSGQGSQYYQMGRELYDNDSVFRTAMDECDQIVKDLTDRSLIDELYVNHSKADEFSNILFTHPAIFSFGYSLFKTLSNQNIQADAVLGYSLGEYVAAVVANSISLKDALRAIVYQAQALSSKAVDGGMLTILTNVEHFREHSTLYEKVDLAGVNYENNFVISGSREDLLEVKNELDNRSIISMMLPVNHGFHSNQMLLVEQDYRDSLRNLDLKDPSIPIYSSSSASNWVQCGSEHFWNITRGEVRFHDLIESIKSQEQWRFIDLSPTGTLSTFLKYGFEDLEFYSAVNQFGRDLESVEKLVKAVSA